jgi:hypothetical protein
MLALGQYARPQREQAERHGVELGEHVVHDRPGPTVRLRNNNQRTKSKMPKTANALVGQHDALSLLYHLDGLFVEKIEMLGGVFCGNHVPRRIGPSSRPGGEESGGKNKWPCGVVDAHLDRSHCHGGRGIVVHQDLLRIR